MNKSALILTALLATSAQLVSAVADDAVNDGNALATTDKAGSEVATTATADATAETTIAPLQITISNVKEQSGHVRVAVYNSESTFQKEGYKYIVLLANAETISFSIDELPVGEYAIMMYHDIDDNEEMKSNLVGMPTEPWGGSLRGTSLFGPPKWKHTKFMHEATGTAFTIALQ